MEAIQQYETAMSRVMSEESQRMTESDHPPILTEQDSVIHTGGGKPFEGHLPYKPLTPHYQLSSPQVQSPMESMMRL